MKLGITMPSRTAPMARIPDYARMAEGAGFESIWTYELYRNPFVMLATSALATSRAELCTGLATAFTRSPFEAANAAADVDELSGGRMKLGLGTGVPEFLGAFHSTDFKAPIGRLGEYVDVLRRSWDYLAGEQVDNFQGKHYQFAAPPINPWGLREQPCRQIPILVAGMRPQLLKLVGAKADGWVGYLYTPKFFEQIVLPNVTEGARSAGRDRRRPGPVVRDHLLCAPRLATSPWRAPRSTSASTSHTRCPMSSPNLKAYLIWSTNCGSPMMQKGPAAFEDTPEELVELFSITGTPEECRQKLDRYKDLPHLALHTSYVPPFTAEESEDCYLQIIDAFKR